MSILNLSECRAVIKEINAGVPAKLIAKNFNIENKDVSLISRCREYKYPLTDYKQIDDADYRFEPINYKCTIAAPTGKNGGSQGWDIRMSLKLAKLPMSKWGDAL